MFRDKLAKRWPDHLELRKTIRSGVECRFLDISSGYIPAARCLIATTPDMGFPIGTVWYGLRERLTVCEILTSYVEPWARRLGVRSALHRTLRRRLPEPEGHRHRLGPEQGVPPLDKTKSGWRLKIRRAK